MNSEKPKSYHKIYRDIINGYSSFPFGGKKVYLRHFSQADFGECEEEKDERYLEAESKGLLSEREKLETLIKAGIWSKKDEKKVKDLELRADGLKDVFKKLFVDKQKKQIQKEIDGIKSELDLLLKEKEELLGLTCEKYSEQQNNIKFLRISLFKTKELKEEYLSEEEYDEISENLLWTLILAQNSVLSNFNQTNLKAVSASPFFLNSIMICENNPFVYFGKPVHSLTNYQMELFVNGIRYKNVIEAGNLPPESLYKDMDSIVEWYEMKITSASAKSSSKNKDGQTYIGATKEETQRLLGDSKTPTVDLLAESKKTGKTELNMMDLLKIHGE